MVFFEVGFCGSADEKGEFCRGEAGAGSSQYEVLGSELVICGEVVGKDDGAAGDEGGFEFGFGRFFDSVAERGFNFADLTDHLLEFDWIEGGLMVGAGEGFVEREVFFDARCAHCDGGDGDVDAEGVVAEANGDLESFAHGLHGAEIDG